MLTDGLCTINYSERENKMEKYLSVTPQKGRVHRLPNLLVDLDRIPGVKVSPYEKTSEDINLHLVGDFNYADVLQKVTQAGYAVYNQIDVRNAENAGTKQGARQVTELKNKDFKKK